MLRQENDPNCSCYGLNFRKECGSTGLKPREFYIPYQCVLVLKAAVGCLPLDG